MFNLEILEDPGKSGGGFYHHRNKAVLEAFRSQRVLNVALNRLGLRGGWRQEHDHRIRLLQGLADLQCPVVPWEHLRGGVPDLDAGLAESRHQLTRPFLIFQSVTDEYAHCGSMESVVSYVNGPAKPCNRENLRLIALFRICYKRV